MHILKHAAIWDRSFVISGNKGGPCIFWVFPHARVVFFLQPNHQIYAQNTAILINLLRFSSNFVIFYAMEVLRFEFPRPRISLRITLRLSGRSWRKYPYHHGKNAFCLWKGAFSCLYCLVNRTQWTWCWQWISCSTQNCFWECTWRWSYQRVKNILVKTLIKTSQLLTAIVNKLCLTLLTVT